MIAQKVPCRDGAEMAFKEAVEEVIDEDARLGLPLYIGRNGKVVKLSPKKVRSLSRSIHRN
jgi:hypothetical protein